MVRDAGIVESITMRNFMCHSNLGPFTFGSNVNFVVGHNGSECRCCVVGSMFALLCIPSASALLLSSSVQVERVPFSQA